MRATEIVTERREIGEGRFAEVVIWEVPAPKKPSRHSLKYRLAFVVNGVCVLRYDNELGKGDHRHTGETETPYVFTSLPQLLRDFWADVYNWRE